MGRRGRPKGSGKQIKQIPTQFDHSDTLKEMAKELIAQHHPHLVNAEIAYLFKNKEIKSGGKTVIGTAKKYSKEVKAISGFDFGIVISYPSFQELTDKQKYAVLDHELTHCLISEDEQGETTYSILRHDVEEFLSIIDRHSLYLEDLKALGRVMENTGCCGGESCDCCEQEEATEDEIDLDEGEKE